MDAEPKKKHILIVNQHGENRGDESAMRAMIDGFEREIGPSRYTLIVQFQDASLKVAMHEDVTMLHMKMPLLSYLGLFAYSAFYTLGIRLPFLLRRRTRQIILAYEQADMVVSAPGGPYFGDIYRSHEILHWFYAWLACLYRKPLFLYAPSAGPFKSGWLNPVRRYMFRKFDVLCVREEISRDYLAELLGEDVEVHVTADSAIQQYIAPCPRAQYFAGDRTRLADKYLVAVSAIEYRFPGETDPRSKQQAYNETLLRCLLHLHGRKDCHFMFIPQLYGRIHSDVPYLERLASGLPEGASWEIVDPAFDSDMQRSLFGMADFCIASRYHPQIFAATAGTPGICIYYEHKALGFMEMLGMQTFAFNIRNPDAEAMCAKLDEVIERRDGLSQRIKEKIVPIRERSRLTSLLAAELFRKKCRHY